MRLKQLLNFGAKIEITVPSLFNLKQFDISIEHAQKNIDIYFEVSSRVSKGFQSVLSFVFELMMRKHIGH